MKKFATLAVVLALIPAPSVWATISDEQKNAIVNYCDTIRGNLDLVRHEDSRARTYLGAYYETILSSYMTPLTLRLVKNNLINANLTQNKIDFANQKSQFSSHFKVYQDSLYELINIDCKNRPDEFYEKLEQVRKERAVVRKDITKLNSYLKDHQTLVEEFKETL